MPELVTLPLPVYAVPGNNPTSPPAVPEIVVGPVFVIALPANTPYVVVVPGRIVGPAAEVITGASSRCVATAAMGIPHNSRAAFSEKFFFM